MQAPETKRNELLFRLIPSMRAGKLLLSEFEIRLVRREASQLPEAHASLMLRGIVCILEGDFVGGKELCERSLAIAPGEVANWVNYSMALASTCHYHEEEVVTRNAFNKLPNNPAIIISTAVFGSHWLRTDLLERAIENAMSIEMDLHKPAIKTAGQTLIMLTSMDKSTVESLVKISDIIRSIADGRVRITGTYIEASGEDTFAFNVFTDLDDPKKLCELETELLIRMIAEGMENGNCFGYFLAKADEVWGYSGMDGEKEQWQ